MEFPSEWADEMGQTTLDAHVNVFIFFPKGMLATSDFQSYPFQSSNDFGALGIGQNFSFFESFAMGDAALNIMIVQSRIER